MNILIPRNLEGRKEKLRQDLIKLLSQKVIEGDLEIDESFEGIPEELVKVKEITGDVYLTINKGYIPSWLKDVKIYRDFYCAANNLSTLKNCPKQIGRSFRCSNNYLTSLSEGPEYVGLNFYCSDNLLNSLEGCPKYIGGSFYCLNNKEKLKLPKDIELKKFFYN